MKIKIIVTLKNGVLDPQGKAIQQTLNGMGFNDVKDVRQGKYFDIDINEKDETKAKSKVDEMCKKLLANLVIEDYKILQQMKSAVIIFPGSNCDRDMDVALKKYGFKNSMIWHDDITLPKCDL